MKKYKLVVLWHFSKEVTIQAENFDNACRIAEDMVPTIELNVDEDFADQDWNIERAGERYLIKFDVYSDANTVAVSDEIIVTADSRDEALREADEYITNNLLNPGTWHHVHYEVVEECV